MPTPPLPLADDYASAWRQVDSLESLGLYRSALEQCERIFILARNDKNEVQSVKALLYIGKNAQLLDEDNAFAALLRLRAGLSGASRTEQAILHSVLGQMCVTFLQENAWRLSNRTDAGVAESEDPKTWSSNAWLRAAAGHYEASLADGDFLKDLPLVDFEAVVSFDANELKSGKARRSTLYELLAFRALAFYAADNLFASEPIYFYELKDPRAFAPVAEFVKARFETSDSASAKWRALGLYRQVLEFARSRHAQTQDPTALIDADLLRLSFVNENYRADDRKALYESALRNLLDAHKSHPAAAEAAFRLAQSVYEADLADGAEEAENAAANRARQALRICEEAMAAHPGSSGAIQCANLAEGIRRKEFFLTLEQAVMPDKPWLAGIRWRNIDKIWIRVVRTSLKELEELNRVGSDKRWAKLMSKKPLTEQVVSLPLDSDYQEHRSDVVMDGLPLGHYAVIGSLSADFTYMGAQQMAFFQCTEMAGITHSRGIQHHVAIAHRETGAPISGVRLTYEQFNYRTGKQEVAATQTTDSKGESSASLPRNGNFRVLATRGADSVYIGDFYSYDRYRDNASDILFAHFFTDRALYRPGQMIYFKAVLYRKDARNVPVIAPRERVNVKFFDANGQIKGAMELTSNEYGSINGVFTAPLGGLAGAMRIQADKASGAATVSVEEYKRPRFETQLNKPGGAYRLGEEIALTGSALNYAGVPVQEGEVRYRVVRRTYFPYPIWRRGYGFPPVSGNEREIANGVTRTDAQGAFRIPFALLPDSRTPKKRQPRFQYTVYADVTDPNGETRSASMSLQAGYAALDVSLDMSEMVSLSELKKIALSVRNLAGEAQAASGKISSQKLVAPAVLFLPRRWANPDRPIYDEKAWRTLAPQFAWKDEDDPANWDREDFTRERSFEGGGDMDLSALFPAPGRYFVALETRDPFGEPVRIEKIVKIWDPAHPNTAFELPAAMALESKYEPGQEARVFLGAADSRLRFGFTWLGEKGETNMEWISTGDKGVERRRAVTEADRGGLSYAWFCVSNNRFYGGVQTIAVPWSNKELDIRFETFRDRLLPGQQEVWRLKVSGPDKDRVSAEMAAAMYDASLDQFKPFDWQRIAFPYRSAYFNLQGTPFQTASLYAQEVGRFSSPPYVPYPALRYVESLGSGRQNMIYGLAEMRAGAPAPPGQLSRDRKMAADGADMDAPSSVDADGAALQEYASADQADAPDAGAPPTPQIRSNLNETVFFFPGLSTDQEGNVVLSFTMNEALTRWKFLAFAHTKTLQQALQTREVITQKDLMVIPNPPRFLREGDVVNFSAKVSSLSAQALEGKANLMLFDAVTMQPLDKDFALEGAQAFSLEAAGSAALSWKLRVPQGGSGAVIWRVVAEAGAFSDGEESMLPVVSNRMLVTETMPMTLRGGQTREFRFDRLDMARHSPTLKTQSLTLEFTGNPVWYAVQALPYLMEYPYQCSEQIFSRLYANTLAHTVVQRQPAIRRVYERWKGQGDGGALAAKLRQNPELKSALLEETPWVLQAQDEELQKQQIALLFDLNRMAAEREKALAQLKQNQYPSGAWPWFEGGQDNWYITQHIAIGFRHLEKLGALNLSQDNSYGNMADNAIGYCNAMALKAYQDIERAVQNDRAKWEDDHLSSMLIHYLYAVSFSPADRPDKVTAFLLDQGAKHWLRKSLHEQGLLALALHRFSRPEAAQRIVNSLRERAQMKDELGMYWANEQGMFWYQQPVETQALMIEVFDEVAADKRAVEELRIWLLKNKQTNRWSNTKATAQAVYALLLSGESWLEHTQPVQISLGATSVKPREMEAGTGYFKEKWTDLKRDWQKVKVVNPNPQIAWGALYWQYFEDLDKITDFKDTPLQINKRLFRKDNTPSGPKLTPLDDRMRLKPGDQIVVRIEIETDRAMEFVHFKDQRAAGLEPLDVLS
ncbi:MAG: alpha-2-macroglobulin family protein, partial [Saprospiraceae bacterium]